MGQPQEPSKAFLETLVMILPVLKLRERGAHSADTAAPALVVDHFRLCSVFEYTDNQLNNFHF
jgi:hypothetical protein